MFFMANDRIFLRCRNCGESTLLAKYYPSNYGVWDRDQLCDFIDKHIECSPFFGRMDLHGDRCFDLFTESAEDSPPVQSVPPPPPHLV